MLHSKSYVKKTRKGQVMKVVREHYLRTDVWSGSPLDAECDPSSHKLSATAAHYLVVDTNVVLHQLDFLEHKALEDIIICSVVLEEVKHKNFSAYQRLRNLISNAERRVFVFANEHHKDTYIQQQSGESINDRNDRAIRVVTKWYASRVPSMHIIMLSNDAANRRKAEEEGLDAMSTLSYARMRTDEPELADLAARYGEEDDGAEEGGGKPRSQKRARLFQEHLSESEVMAGIASGKYHQGSLRVGTYNPWEGYVGSEAVGQDILLSGRPDMNRALHGDIVAVELLPESQWKGPSRKLPQPRGADKGKAQEGEGDAGEDDGSADVTGQAGIVLGVDETAPVLQDSNRQPTGRVVGIVKRNWRSRGYCGSLDPGNKPLRSGVGQDVLFRPVEQRLPRIKISTRHAADLLDKRIVVVIDSWPVHSPFPMGHYVRTLGEIGSKDVETEVVLVEHDINTNPFSDAVHACVPPLPWRVVPEDEQDIHRKDLRHISVCSVDPPGCKDIDDALHVRRLPNGNFEMGVHIADVTHFVKPDTAMDLEAAARATTVYLVNRRIDMLPKPLTEDICSLRGGEERLAFSVLWELNANAEPVAPTVFTKSIIRSRAALTYAEAQALIDDSSKQDELSVMLRDMNRLAKILRQRRADAGALQLASPEVKFELDTDSLDPLDVGLYQVRETNQMVEEMMLLANIHVAQKILQHYPACAVLRRHPTPPPRQFQPVIRAAACAGFTLDVSSSKALSVSLDLAVRADDRYFNKLVRIMTTRCMTAAQYFSSGDHPSDQYHHYGLASPVYTHFTSPIRRYADVVVHRLLAAALGITAFPESIRNTQVLRAVVGNMNERHHNAQLAGRASVELHTLIFFNNRTVLAEARVTKVKANGLLVFVPMYGIEGPVYLTTKDGANADEFTLDEDKQTIMARDGSKQFTVFDKCQVQVEVVEAIGRRRHLKLSLSSGTSDN